MSLPEGFAGGTPELWDDRIGDEAPFTDFRSAPDRDLLEATLSLSALVPGATVLELGCGASRFLPHLAAKPRIAVAGVDFSERGIALTIAALRSRGADDSGIVLGTIDDYVATHRSSFDVVVSFGLVEHFDDLDAIVRRHFDAVRDGGTVMISAPNLSAVNRAWARLAAPDLFTWHRPIAARDVVAAVMRAGGDVVSVRHLGGPRLYAQGNGRISFRLAATNVVRKIVNAVGEALFRLSPAVARRVGGRNLSPVFAVVATKPR